MDDYREFCLSALVRLLAIIAGIAVGIMVAIGGARDGGQDAVSSDVLPGLPGMRLGGGHPEFGGGAGGTTVIDAPAWTPTATPLGSDGPTRLVLGALAGDGTPEPGVTAAAVSETVAIPEPVVKESLTPAVFDAGSVQALIVLYDWPDEDALRIAYCESRYDPNAVNPHSGAAGVFQFLDYWHHDKLAPGESWFDPAVNVRIAYQVWLDQGWQPWNVGGCW